VYGLVPLVAPATEPVSVADALDWLRLDPDTPDSATVTALLRAARGAVERLAGRALVSQQWRLTLDGFPGRQGGARPGTPAQAGGGWTEVLGGGWFYPDASTIRLPRAPLLSVQQVQYVDTAGGLQTLSPTVYAVDVTQDPGRLTLAQYQVWPLTRLGPAVVRVDFTAGYTAGGMPEEYLLAMKMLAAHWYEHRGEEGQTQDVPPVVLSLLRLMDNGALEYGP